MRGLFGNMFDFDHDGELNACERAMELEFLEEPKRKKEEDDDIELEISGLASFELEFVDPEERREALEDAGLDPDEYDF